MNENNDKENMSPVANMSADSTTDITPSTMTDGGKNEKPPSATNASNEQHQHAEQPAGPVPTTDDVPGAGKEEAVAESITAAAPEPLDASYMDVMESATLLSHGQSLLSNKQWNLACEALSRCVERAASEFGDTALPLAPLYALYGRALVEHWTSAQDALGDKAREVQAEKRINEGAGGLIGDDDVDSDGQAQGEVDANTDDSMAWEALDLARVIYQRNYDAMGSGENGASSSSSAPSTSYPLPVPTTRLEMGVALVSVLLRLGDLHQEQEKFVEAAADYNRALDIQRTLLPAHSRDKASTHMELAVCSLWQQQPALALQHYTQAYNILHHRLLWLMAGKPTAAEQPLLSTDLGEEKRLLESKVKLLESEWKSESEEEKKEAAEYRDLIAELKERIDEMIAEIGKQATSSSSSSSSSSLSSSHSSSSSSSNGFSATPFSIPALSFPVSASFSTTTPPASVSSESTSTKRKADEEVGGSEWEGRS